MRARFAVDPVVLCSQIGLESPKKQSKTSILYSERLAEIKALGAAGRVVLDFDSETTRSETRLDEREFWNEDDTSQQDTDAEVN